jgi:hypothetical protein
MALGSTHLLSGFFLSVKSGRRVRLTISPPSVNRLGGEGSFDVLQTSMECCRDSFFTFIFRHSWCTSFSSDKKFRSHKKSVKLRPYHKGRTYGRAPYILSMITFGHMAGRRIFCQWLLLDIWQGAVYSVNDYFWTYGRAPYILSMITFGHIAERRIFSQWLFLDIWQSAVYSVNDYFWTYGRAPYIV